MDPAQNPWFGALQQKQVFLLQPQPGLESSMAGPPAPPTGSRAAAEKPSEIRCLGDMVQRSNRDVDLTEHRRGPSSGSCQPVPGLTARLWRTAWGQRSGGLIPLDSAPESPPGMTKRRGGQPEGSSPNLE